jgi:hypothetical protein
MTRAVAVRAIAQRVDYGHSRGSLVNLYDLDDAEEPR